MTAKKTAPKASKNEPKIASLNQQQVRTLTKQLGATGPGAKHPDIGERPSVHVSSHPHQPQDDEGNSFHGENRQVYGFSVEAFSPTQLAQLVSAFQKSVMPVKQSLMSSSSEVQTDSNASPYVTKAVLRSLSISPEPEGPESATGIAIRDMNASLETIYMLVRDFIKAVEPVSVRYPDEKSVACVTDTEPEVSHVEHSFNYATTRLNNISDDLRKALRELRI